MSKQYALVFDLRRCVGCQTCTIACKLENSLAVGENWIQVVVLGEPSKEWEKVKYPQLKMAFQPLTCMHCQNPPCLEACPDKAIYRREDGIILIDTPKCTGCQLCLPACPYGVIHFDAENKIVRKCNLCYQRIDHGMDPFCARECPAKAIHFGDINEPGSELFQLIFKRKGYILQPEAGTQPSHHYLK